MGRVGNEIAGLSAHIQAAAWRLLRLIREFDAGEGWHEEGFRSCAAWLSWRTGITPGAAREKVRVARALERLPRLSEALRRGELSYSVARALTRVATPENEAELVEVARHVPASQVERLVAGWRSADRSEARERDRARHQERALWVVPQADGSWVIRGRLEPEVGAVLRAALAAAADALYAGEAADPEAPAEARRADALGLVAESALGGGLRMLPATAGDPEAAVPSEDAAAASDSAGPAENGHVSAPRDASASAAPSGQAAASTVPAPRPVIGRAERYQVVVHVSAETLEEDGDGSDARIEAGPRVSAETSRRLACDAGRVVMTHRPDGGVLDVGRRDDGCRFPGCSSRHCDAHHVRHWADGGETRLDNLVLVCRRHHRLVHEEGWRVERAADGDVRFYRPDGRLLPEVPAPAPVAAYPAAALRRVARELAIGPWTPTPRWTGERLDVDWALFTLRRPVRPDVSAETSAAEDRQ